MATLIVACGSSDAAEDAAVADASSPDALVMPDAEGMPDAAGPDAVVVVHTVSVSIDGDGQGRVTSSPAGIDCDTSCTASFPEGTEVVLTAAPTRGDFAGWSDACSGTGSCMVTVDADKLVGASFADTCGAPIVCPEPTGGGMVTVCGRIVDTGTGEPMQATEPTTAPCDPDAPTDTGPCSLDVAVYDALGFAAGPTGVSPQAVGESMVDECGRFRLANVARPFSGLIAIGVDGPARALTGRMLETGPGETITNVAAYATASSTDASWTSSAGLAGASFANRGVVMAIFRHGDAPVGGVGITRGGMLVPAESYYFSADDTGTTRATIDPTRSTTGPNGAALMIGSSLGQHSGTGGEPAGCAWPDALAVSAPPAVWVVELAAYASGSPELACP